jgi:hypothetical protein
MTMYFNPNTKNESMDDGLKTKVYKHLDGLNWFWANDYGDSLSVILHNGSYGGSSGKFEICPSWRKPQRNNEVKGWLSFGEVQRWINELKRLTKSKDSEREYLLNEQKKKDS